MKKTHAKKFKNINEKPLFFLFTCVKEGRKYIEKLFNSLLLQTEINFVHYIYEDGSQDPIQDLVEEYKMRAAKLKNPYRVIYERNRINIGLNAATQHCIDMCTLPYFIWIDCDNWVDKDFFKNLGRYIKKHKNKILIRTLLINQYGENEARYSKKFKLEKKNRQLKNYLYGTFVHGFFCVKKNEYLKINKENFFFSNREFFNDEQVLLTCMLSKKGFGYCDKSIGIYFERSDNESTLYCNKDLNYLFKLYASLVARYDEKTAKQIPYILQLRKIFNQMVKIKRDNPNEAYRLFKEMNFIIKQNKIGHQFRYRYGNYFYWKAVIHYCLMRYEHE